MLTTAANSLDWASLAIQAVILIGSVAGLYVALVRRIDRLDAKLVQGLGLVDKKISDERLAVVERIRTDVETADEKHVERYHARTDPSGVIATHSDR